PQDAGENLGEITDASQLADAVAAHIQTKVADKQAMLSETDPLKRGPNPQQTLDPRLWPCGPYRCNLCGTRTVGADLARGIRAWRTADAHQ
ncbi:MAG: hypothetical protein ACKN98_01440, partial [Candidatus Limnocylindrus sp.]